MALSISTCGCELLLWAVEAGGGGMCQGTDVCEGFKNFPGCYSVGPQESRDWSLRQGEKPWSCRQMRGEFLPSSGARGDRSRGASVHPALSSLHPLRSPFLLLPFPSAGPSWAPALLYAPPGSGLGGWGLSPFQLLGECGFSPQRAGFLVFP